MRRTEPKPSVSILCVAGAWIKMLLMLSFRDRSLQMLFVGRWKRLLKGRVFLDPKGAPVPDTNTCAESC